MNKTLTSIHRQLSPAWGRGMGLLCLLVLVLSLGSLSGQDSVVVSNPPLDLDKFFSAVLSEESPQETKVKSDNILSTQVRTKKVQENQKLDDYRLNLLKFRYEEKLRSTLDLYFDPSSYFATIDLDVSIEQSKEIPTLEIETGEPDNTSLPGIPFVPESMLKDRDSQKSEVELEAVIKDVKTSINQVKLTLLIDSSFTEEQVSLMRTMASSTLNLRPERGDQIIMRLYAFPGRQEPMIRSTVSNDSLRVYSDRDVVAEVKNSPQEDEPTLSRSNLWIWVLLLILAFFLSLFIANLLRKRRTESDESAVMVNPGHALQAIDAQLPDRRVAMSSAFDDESLDQMMKAFIETPEQIAYLFDQWISLSESKGARKAAQLIHLTDSRFLPMLEPFMSKEICGLVNRAYEDQRDLFLELSNIEIQRLRSEFAHILRSEVLGNLSEFRFLNYVSNDIILRICRDLSHEQTAILIKNLPTEKASELIKSLNPLNAGRVLYLIGKKDFYDSEALKQTARKVFMDYVQLNNAVEYKDKNVTSLIKIIEDLPVDNQSSMLRMLSEQDPDLYNMVRKHIFTWDHIFSFSNRILREALVSVESRSIAFAIVDMREEHADRLLQIRSEREQQLIMEMIANQEMIPDEDIEEAKLLIIRTVKSYVDHENRRDALVKSAS